MGLVIVPSVDALYALPPESMMTVLDRMTLLVDFVFRDGFFDGRSGSLAESMVTFSDRSDLLIDSTSGTES